MLVLITGLIIFFGIHSTRIFSDSLREQMVLRFGLNAWRGVYSLASLAGLVLIIWGYGLARSEPQVIWTPPLWTRDLALVLTWIAFIQFPAASIPFNHFKQFLGHPMYAGLRLWAFAHLLANGRIEDILLFGAFLVWGILGYASCRRRDRRMGITYPSGEVGKTLVCVVAGTAVWALFALVLHRWLFGVAPI